MQVMIMIPRQVCWQATRNPIQGLKLFANRRFCQRPVERFHANLCAAGQLDLRWQHHFAILDCRCKSHDNRMHSRASVCNTALAENGCAHRRALPMLSLTASAPRDESVDWLGEIWLPSTEEEFSVASLAGNSRPGRSLEE